MEFTNSAKLAASLIPFGPEGLLPLPAVMVLTTLSKSKIYKDIKLGTFPKPVKLGARKSAWRAKEIESWLDSRTTDLAA